MDELYYGVRVDSGEKVIIKIVSDSQVNNVSYDYIRSPFLVRFYESFICGNKRFYVMEYCSGKNLQTLIETCREYNVHLPEDVSFLFFFCLFFFNLIFCRRF
jgi:serine/threonine protein kinase